MDLSKIKGSIWFDGEIIDWQDANVHLLTHTLHYGLGVFEGVRAYSTPKGSSIFRLEDHTDRLFKSAETVSLKIPFSKTLLNDAHKEVIKLNNLTEAYIRPMCFYGSEGMGLRADNLEVHCMVAAWEWPSYMEPEAREKGIKVKLSSYTFGYSQEVTKFTEGSFSIPVKIIHNNTNEVKIFPKTVDVFFTVPLEAYESVKASDFEVVCDFNTHSSQDDFIVVELKKSPAIVKSARLGIKQIKYIVVN